MGMSNKHYPSNLRLMLRCLVILCFSVSTNSWAELVYRNANITVGAAQYQGKLGYLVAPENRSNPDSRAIKVAFLQIHSQKSPSTQAVFRFHGGPDNDAQLGEKLPLDFLSQVDFSQTSTIDFDFDISQRAYAQFLAFSDLVLIDGRGMGLSQPHLACPKSPEPIDLMKSFAEREPIMKALLVQCRDWLVDQGTDLKGYNLLEITEDIEAIRSELGYPKISIYGGSFGTQTAFAYLKKYSHRVKAAALVGIEGLAHSYDRPGEVQAASLKLIAMMNQDKALTNILPEGDMGYTLDSIFKELQDNPRSYEISSPEGEVLQVPFTPDTARMLLSANGMLLKRGDTENSRGGGAAGIPPLALALYHKAYAGIANDIEKNYQKFRQQSVFNAAVNLIDCASSGSPLRLQEIEQDVANTSILYADALSYGGLQGAYPDHYCQYWGDIKLPSSFLEKFSSPTPMLLINGRFDGSTPLPNAQDIHQQMPNIHLILVDNAAHVSDEIFHYQPQLLQQTAEFLQSGDIPKELPTEFTLPPVKFKILPSWVVFLFNIGLGNQLMALQ
jgi:pimeloyl-ACP methyl ester carboxylesterase